MENENASGLPTPFEAQNRILKLAGRFKVAVCGRRFGKTVAAAIAAVRKCEEKASRNVGWVSPVQKQSDRVEREIAYWLKGQMVRRMPDDLDTYEGEEKRPLWQHSKSENALICENGSRIEFHSAQAAEHLRGAGLDLLVVDEAADVPEDVWESVLKPMLLDRHGEAYIIGTPRGKNHWLHRVFLLGQSGGGTYASVQMPSRMNPRLPLEDLNDYLLGMSPEKFRQEYEAEFIDGAETIFAKLAECVSGEALARGRSGARYVTGIDLGQMKDFTVACSLACDTNRMEGFVRFNQLDWSVQQQTLLEHLKNFPGPVLMDSTGVGAPVYEYVRDHWGWPVHGMHFTASNRAEFLGGLQLGISAGELKLADVPILVQELNAFSYLETPESRMGARGGTKKMGAPAGLHDDCVMALALAWYGLKKMNLWAAAERPAASFGVNGFFA